MALRAVSTSQTCHWKGEGWPWHGELGLAKIQRKRNRKGEKQSSLKAEMNYLFTWRSAPRKDPPEQQTPEVWNQCKPMRGPASVPLLASPLAEAPAAGNGRENVQGKALQSPQKAGAAFPTGEWLQRDAIKEPRGWGAASCDPSAAVRADLGLQLQCGAGLRSVWAEGSDGPFSWLTSCTFYELLSQDTTLKYSTQFFFLNCFYDWELIVEAAAAW